MATDLLMLDDALEEAFFKELWKLVFYLEF